MELPVSTLFKRHFGHKPPHVVQAPGRLELIGNHTDYNEGLVMALAVSASSMVLFTVGALGMAAAIGLGNGAVFKLVPQFFPSSVGSVTGLVGAAGGLAEGGSPAVPGRVRWAGALGQGGVGGTGLALELAQVGGQDPQSGAGADGDGFGGSGGHR